MNAKRQNTIHTAQEIKLFIKRYERHLSGAAFVIGFVADSLVLPRIDFWGAYVILGGYLLLVMTTMLLSLLHDTNHAIKKYLTPIATTLSVITQFFFGSLMSAVFVYYSRSATILESMPFMLLLLVVFVGNELFRARLNRLEFQVAILFFILYMDMTFAVPVFLGAMGPTIFLLSGAAALLLIVLYILFLRIFARATIMRAKWVFAGSIGGILLIINVLYFTHLIPPIPLSLRAAGIYHSVVRTQEGAYRASGEKMSIFERLTHSYPVVHINGEPLYFFSAIFAPTTFSTSIVHVWQYYEEDTKTWTTKYHFTFPITGGRDEGYRGYSIKNNIIPGHWRVRVETTRGELLGSETFVVMLATSPILLEEQTL